MSIQNLAGKGKHRLFSVPGRTHAAAPCPLALRAALASHHAVRSIRQHAHTFRSLKMVNGGEAPKWRSFRKPKKMALRTHRPPRWRLPLRSHRSGVSGRQASSEREGARARPRAACGGRAEIWGAAGLMFTGVTVTESVLTDCEFSQAAGKLVVGGGLHQSHNAQLPLRHGDSAIRQC